jgi:transposase
VSHDITPDERLRHLENRYTQQVTAFRQRLAQLGPDRVLIILLDIGKNVHWVTVRTAADQELVAPCRLPTTQPGLTQFIHMVERLMAQHQPALVILGHEPSGVYHEPWARALLDHFAAHRHAQAQPPVDYRFFNPYQVKLARQQTHLRHRKSDPRDLAAMFDLALRGLGQPAFLPTGVEHLLRSEVGFIQGQAHLLGVLEHLLYHLLDRLWPGAVVNVQQFVKAHPHLPRPTPIVETRPFQRDRLRVLLAHCPNPYHLRAMSEQDILALYRQHAGRAGPALLATLRTWADHAVLLPQAEATPLADQLQRLFGQYQSVETVIDDARARLIPLLPYTPVRHIVAVPGLGEMDAAAYQAGIGSAARFQRDGEVWAFAGYDPVTDGTGDHPDRVGHLAKHGDPAFREALFLMGYRVAQNYAPVSLTFLDAFDRGKSEVEATIHAAHRVNRICFHLVQHDEPFEDRATPQQQADKARRWALFRAAKPRRPNRRTRGPRRR